MGSIGEQTTEALNAKGIKAYWEGSCIRIPFGGGAVVFGTANKTWCGDLTNAAGDCTRSFDLKISTDSPNIAGIADAIAKTITALQREARTLSDRRSDIVDELREMGMRDPKALLTTLLSITDYVGTERLSGCHIFRLLAARCAEALEKMKSMKITNATIGPLPEGMFDPMPNVTATFEDGTEKVLFSFYPDEITFRSQEFIGLTEEEAHLLRQRKDVAYLRS